MRQAGHACGLCGWARFGPRARTLHELFVAWGADRIVLVSASASSHMDMTWRATTDESIRVRWNLRPHPHRNLPKAVKVTRCPHNLVHNQARS